MQFRGILQVVPALVRYSVLPKVVNAAARAETCDKAAAARQAHMNV